MGSIPRRRNEKVFLDSCGPGILLDLDSGDGITVLSLQLMIPPIDVLRFLPPD